MESLTLSPAQHPMIYRKSVTPFSSCFPPILRGGIILTLSFLAQASGVIASYQTNDPAYPGATRFEQANQAAFAALKSDGSVVTWGDAGMGGDSSQVSNNLSGGVTDIFSSLQAFAALKTNGSVVCWGGGGGGDASALTNGELSSGVATISSTAGAFAALKKNRSVVTWGDAGMGGDSSQVSNNLTYGVIQVYATESAFAALTQGGSIVAWGDPNGGGDSSLAPFSVAGGVTKVVPNGAAFAALLDDGSVVTWGDSTAGGNSAIPGPATNVFATQKAFAAIGAGGSVTAWGDTNYGGDCSAVAPSLTGGVTKIFSTLSAFAALKTNGTVVVWGNSSYFDPGTGNYSTAPTNQLTGVRTIVTTQGDFAAIRTNGAVIVWGGSPAGAPWIQPGITNQLISGVTNIVANAEAFAALKTNGSVVAWGDSAYGGDASSVSNSIKSGVQQVFATDSAFAALKTDGSVVTWGNTNEGGRSSQVAARLTGVSVLASPFLKIRGTVQTIDLGPLTNSQGALFNISYTTNSISIPPLSGVPSGLPVTLTVTSGPATLTGSPTLGYKLTLTGTAPVTLTAQQAGNNTYRAAIGSTATVAVGKGTQQILFPGITNSLTYTTNPALNPFKITLPVSSVGLAISNTVSGPAFLSNNTLRMLGAGTFTLTATNAGNSNYFGAGISTNYVIAKGFQTITQPAVPARTFSTNPAANVFTVNLPSLSSAGLSVTNSIVLGGPATISGNRISVTGAGTVTILSTNGGNANYLPASTSTNFVVAKAPQSITFPAIPNRTFSTNPAANSFPITLPTSGSQLPVSNSVSGPASLSSNILTVTGAGTVTLVSSQTGNTNFLAAPRITNSFTVGKIPQVITFAQPSPQAYSSNGLAPLSASAPGGQITFSSASPGVISISGTNAVIHGAGSAVITALMGTNQISANYLGAASVARTLTVNKAPQTIPAFAAIPQTPYASVVTLTNSNSSAGLPVTYAVKSGPATVKGNLVTVTGIGTVTLSANQPGNGNYLAASQITTSFTTTRAAQSITFVPPSSIPVGVPITLAATSSSGLPVTYSNASPSLATLAGSVLTPKTNAFAQAITIVALQAGNANYQPAASLTNTIALKKFQSINFAPSASVTFTNNGTFQLSAIASPFTLPITYVSSNTNILSIAGSTATMHAKGAVSITASQIGGGDYAPAASVTKTITLR